VSTDSSLSGGLRAPIGRDFQGWMCAKRKLADAFSLIIQHANSSCSILYYSFVYCAIRKGLVSVSSPKKRRRIPLSRARTTPDIAAFLLLYLLLILFLFLLSFHSNSLSPSPTPSPTPSQPSPSYNFSFSFSSCLPACPTLPLAAIYSTISRLSH
jgi:hypothetical protein